MYPLKLPYYPQTPVTAESTPGGLIEISNPGLYDVPLPNKVILRVDLLSCLSTLLGESCLICRDYLYTVVAGKGDFSVIFGHMYRRHKGMFKYVNDIHMYGDSDVPLIDRCIDPLREIVRDNEEKMMSLLSASGAKYLVTTHGYLYVCYSAGREIPNVMGGKRIC